MKKYIIYLGILTGGLFLGWLLFGGSSNREIEHAHDVVEEVNHMWTCSMHPQIMQAEPGDCPLCGMELIPATVSTEGLAADQFKLSKNAMALANIQTTVIGEELSSDNSIALSGKIAENEESNSVQVSYFSGRIEKLNISFTGEKIHKGQLLATIYSPELYAAQQELLTAYNLKESQPELYKAVRNKLKIWKLSDRQINQIETSGVVKEIFPIYATVSGTVSAKLVEEGASIKQGQPLLKINDLTTVWGNFDVYENQISLFGIGEIITVTSNAYPDKIFNGKVNFIDPVLNTKTRTVTLRVVLENKNNLFKPGMFVEGQIALDSSIKNQTIILAPASAILWTGKRSVVYLKTNPTEPVFEMREIELGQRIGNKYVITQGLSKGDEVVSNGAFTIDAAAQLQGKKSMMNKSGGVVLTGHEGHTGMQPKASPSNTTLEEHVKLNTVDNGFKTQLKKVFHDYIKIKELVMLEDLNNMSNASNQLLASLSKVNMRILTKPEVHSSWMSLEEDIKSTTANISGSTDIKVIKKQFNLLTINLSKAIEIFGINETVYLQFCPMAVDNNGAFWLSKNETVNNPYFNGSMLKCGEVKQILK